MPTSLALKALVLNDRLADLGLGGRFEDSTARVLVTVGEDGLPQTLTFEGSSIDVSEAGLPDYVVEELVQARYLVTYDEADLDEPIQAPRGYLVP